MKKIILSLLLSVLSLKVAAQSGQRKVLLQQIAALKVYIDYARKGYDIARKGLNLIGEVKEGEFDLHSGYFTSLGLVNPAVRNYARIGEIIALGLKIMELQSDCTRLAGTTPLLNEGERGYISRVTQKLEVDCLAQLEELDTLLSDGSLQMSDQDRLSRIDLLYNTMLDNYTFCKSFATELSSLLQVRQREQKDIQWHSDLQGL